MESLFCLAHARGSRLVLLGIANSIDLVQQLMRPGGSGMNWTLRRVDQWLGWACPGLAMAPQCTLTRRAPLGCPPTFPPCPQRHNLHPQHAVFPAYRERDFVTVSRRRCPLGACRYSCRPPKLSALSAAPASSLGGTQAAISQCMLL